MTATAAKRYPIQQLREFTQRVLQSFQVPAADARLAADVLAAGDLRGIDSHGIARLPMYADFLARGRINPRPHLQVLRQSASTARVDGDHGLGLVVGPRANEIAMDKAAVAGSGWVSVGNSTHFGIAGYYPLQAVTRDLIGWAMTNGTSWVAPIGGSERRLGTNPLAVAFPADTEAPIVIDMATSAVAYGKIQLARRGGQTIPAGWALDQQGQPTTDPMAVDDNGSLLPLGSDRPHGAHKGFCLASLVDILSGVLGGANWGPFVPPFVLTDYNTPSGSVGKGIGHFFGALHIEAFLEAAAFKTAVDQWIRTIRTTRPVPGGEPPLVPGDPERFAHEERSRQGVPLPSSVVESLRQLGRQQSVPIDLDSAT